MRSSTAAQEAAVLLTWALPGSHAPRKGADASAKPRLILAKGFPEKESGGSRKDRGPASGRLRPTHGARETPANPVFDLPDVEAARRMAEGLARSLGQESW